jgi:hypothetical protein
MNLFNIYSPIAIFLRNSRKRHLLLHVYWPLGTILPSQKDFRSGWRSLNWKIIVDFQLIFLVFVENLK